MASSPVFSQFDDAYDASGDAIAAIDARLSRLGMQLEEGSAENLRHVLENLLGLVEVDLLPNVIAEEEAMHKSEQEVELARELAK